MINKYYISIFHNTRSPNCIIPRVFKIFRKRKGQNPINYWIIEDAKCNLLKLLIGIQKGISYKKILKPKKEKEKKRKEKKVSIFLRQQRNFSLFLV